MVDCEGISLGSSCAKLPHSRSAEISKTPPPGAGPKGGGKMLAIRVHMLDDNVTLFQVQAKALGRVLFDQVCKQLHLLEADYFGLEYKDTAGTRYWLDLEKPLSRQVGLSMVEPLLHFCVKFYTPDPAQLEEEFTRYLFCLQIKRDLAQGHMQCNDNTAALMASYIVQAECGDYSAEDYPDHNYLSSYKFVQHQNADLEKKIMENHKKHIGQSPAEADLNLLETARRCELYGMKMHPVKDHEGVPLNLAVAHMGIVVFQNYMKIYTFSWAKVRKISFKRKRFLIKLHPDGYGYYKDVVEFFFESRNECKNLWKKCVENHGFFRCSSVKRTPRQRTRVLSRGSSFRYSGKTQKQMVEFVRENYVKRQNFQRSQSFRQSSSVHSSVATNVGGSISAHPLIPLGECSIVSASCGSMVLAGVEEASQSQTFPVKTTMTGVTTTKKTSLTTPAHERTSHETGSLNICTTTTITTTTSSTTNTSSSPINNRLTTGSGIINNTSHPPTTSATDEQAYPQSPPKVNINNNNNIATSTPKMNGGPTHNGEITSPELSPMKMANVTDTLDGEVKKKRYSTDKSYFIVKELLMTERTFKKDIEVISIRLKDQFESKPLEDAPSIWRLIHLIEPVDSTHVEQLKAIENHVANWESRTLPQNRLADVIVGITQHLPIYFEYLNEVESVLADLSKDLTREPFETLYTTFEQFKGCYLPLTLFILKPLQRILHYAQIVERLMKHYGQQHPDFSDCEKAFLKLSDVNQLAEKVLAEAENYVQLLELSRDLAGFEGTLTEGGRRFVRQGCLAKFSQKKGYQQRMFFLLSDMLLYSNLVGNSFKVHGQLPLKSLALEEREDNPSPHSFTIYSEKRAITVSASSQEEKDKWLEDLSQAIEQSKIGPNRNTSLISLKCSSSADDVSEKDKNDEARATPQRSNTTVHVCWHRNTSVCLNDQIRAAQNQLSGYLLRKFKNSNGWQKLWVVFTNFCLFFYKTYQDAAPLASLPLLGYSVSPPAPGDEINKDFVFKLQFKNHVYFFRAESQYTFDRWMEVIGSATMHSGRARLFSRKESSLERIYNSN